MIFLLVHFAAPAVGGFSLFVPSPAAPELPFRGEPDAGQGLRLSQLAKIIVYEFYYTKWA